MRSDLACYAFKNFGIVDKGLKRNSNQDKIIQCSEYGFYGVSDGMGGLPCGGETSEIVAQCMPELIEHCAHEALHAYCDGEGALELCTEAIQGLSESIYDETNKGKTLSFGATFSGVWLYGSEALFVNIGDSRGYLLNDKTRSLSQITIDHNRAQTLVDSGKLTPSEALGHKASSQLTRFIGMKAPALVDGFRVQIEPNDKILICSDGLYSELNNDHLKELLCSKGSLSRISNKLVAAACSSGGRDNIAAIIIEIKE